jgi:membrane protease YdiL (CAAX protease family)
LAIFLSALFWGFAHSTYAFFPVYLRGIELTIFGSIFVLVFLRYGFETVVLAHFVIDAVIVGMPLMRSHNFYFIISGVFVIFLPLIIFYCVKNNYCPLMRIKKESAGI